MVRCPFCQYENEEGALYCEQCKSDLASDPLRSTLPYGSPSYRESLGQVGSISELPAAEPVSALAAPEVVSTAAPVETQPGPEAGAPAPFNPSDTMRSIPSVEAVGAAPTPSSTSAPTVSGLGGPVPPGVTPKLVVLRGLKITLEYPIYEGLNFIGRADDKPVDIDLEDQEPPDRIWSSRQHACIAFENGILTIEDLNSSNGTFVNRTRVYPGQKRQLYVNDVVQIGTVQLKLKI